MKSFQKTIFIVLMLCLLMVAGSPKPVQASGPFQRWGTADTVKTLLLLGSISVHPKVAGLTFSFFTVITFSEENYSAATYCASYSALNYHVLDAELSNANGLTEQRQAKLKNMGLNLVLPLAVLATVVALDKPKEGQGEETARIFLTPYEDSFALNYHLRF